MLNKPLKYLFYNEKKLCNCLYTGVVWNPCTLFPDKWMPPADHVPHGSDYFSLEASFLQAVILGRILLLLAWVPSCWNAPGKWWNHHLWGFLRKGHVWHLGMWLSGHGGDGLTVGPGGFSDLPQPLWLYDSKVIQLQEAYFVKHQWCVLYLSNSEVGVTDFTEVCFLPQQRRQFHICKKFL